MAYYDSKADLDYVSNSSHNREFVMALSWFYNLLNKTRMNKFTLFSASIPWMGKERWRILHTLSWSLCMIQTSKTTLTIHTRPSRYLQTFIKEASYYCFFFFSLTGKHVTDFFLAPAFVTVFSSSSHPERVKLDAGAGESIHGEQPRRSIAVVASIWECDRRYSVLPR